MLKSLKNANKVFIKVYEWTFFTLNYHSWYMIDNNLRLFSFNTLQHVLKKLSEMIQEKSIVSQNK